VLVGESISETSVTYVQASAANNRINTVYLRNYNANLSEIDDIILVSVELMQHSPQEHHEAQCRIKVVRGL